ncbi:MAG: T9SS type A sorting domain-containing protein, partial [Bacteroidota bacterium]|nr:T9SS type A sorting domain-containing protein [Bacteroidota bacterium]
RTIKFRLGSGANGIDAGTLAPNESYEVQFKVTVNNPGTGNPVPSIINTARIKATSDANVDFVDDGTAIINPEAGALAVTLIYFTASLPQSNAAKINWGTSMEINCKYFDVERSADGNIFTKVATVQGNGTTSSTHNYSITDNISSLTSSIVYYRLKQVDIDGKQNFSNIVALHLKKDNRQFVVSPNPFSDKLNINLEWNTDELATIKIINTWGKDVLIKTVQLTKGLNYIKLNDLSKLSAGNYFIKVISTGESISQKIIKQ